MLFSWLLASLSESFHARVIHCKHSHQLWTEINKHFQSHILAKARQLKSELYNTTKGDRSISDYLLRIQTIADNLSAIGEPISYKDHINVILEGLREESESLALSISSRSVLDPPTLSEVESLLSAKEMRLQKLRDSSKQTLFSANVAHLEISPQVTDQASQTTPDTASVQVAQFNNPDNHSYRGRGHGRSGGRNSIVCQVCGKMGIMH
ncbi:unnamed protein product [Cuscuta europaea]|uniref:Retrotransposon gag domain-containing protein n=1 Tax=Cuscuta europaea TaxID=41803 RepID=A0A9P0ZW46_CUSEU|nr:unnamed protein product [Cuscuta europaea]